MRNRGSYWELKEEAVDRCNSIRTPTVNHPGSATEETFQQPTRPADDVTMITKGLQESTKPIDWDDGEV